MDVASDLANMKPANTHKKTLWEVMIGKWRFKSRRTPSKSDESSGTLGAYSQNGDVSLWAGISTHIGIYVKKGSF